MRKGSDLIGKPVVTFDTGEQFEKIQDLLFDQTSNQLLGFVVDEGGWFSGARVLPINRIQALGPDTVIVPDRKAVIPADTDQVIRRILERNNVLRGTRIVTTDGKELGTLVDLYFDEQTGMVEGYEVSGGIFADAVSGRAFVPAPHAIKIGQDVAFVPPETAQMMEEQVGGLRGAAQSAADSVSNTVTANTVDQTAGRRVREVVRTDQGLIIAAPGQIVTEQVINRARTYHKEQELMDATGLSTGDAARGAVSGAATSISGAASSAGESVREGTQSAKAGAANLWERVKTKVGDTQQTMAEEAEERRIKNAVGRPVTRVILDPQDNVILNVGEIITHQAVERSRAVGVLDMLLSSVYDKDPEISPDELRAPEPGQAALEQQDKGAGA
jgi:uncharacterized protein YrrD